MRVDPRIDYEDDENENDEDGFDSFQKIPHKKPLDADKDKSKKQTRDNRSDKQ